MFGRSVWEFSVMIEKFKCVGTLSCWIIYDSFVL